MGASITKNLIDLTMDAVATVTNDFAATQIQDSSATTDIYIKNYDTVTIGSITQSATASLTSTNIANIIQNSSVQQDLTASLSQVAKSVVDGIPIASLSEADNEIKAAMSATVTMMNSSSSVCSSSSTARASISLIRDSSTGGVIDWGEISQESTASLVSSCYAEAVQSNSAMQTMKATLDQSAEAVNKGLDIFGFLSGIGMIIGLLILGGVLVVGVPVAIAFKSFFKYLLIIVGVILLAIGAVMASQKDKADEMSARAYSSLLGDNPGCRATVLGEKQYLYDPLTGEENQEGFANAVEASFACKENPECVAYQFERGTINQFTKNLGVEDIVDDDGVTQMNPATTFYKSVDVDKCAPFAISNVSDSKNPGSARYDLSISGKKDQQNIFKGDNKDMYGIYPDDAPDPNAIDYILAGCPAIPRSGDVGELQGVAYDCEQNFINYKPLGFVWIKVKLNEARNSSADFPNYGLYRLQMSQGAPVWKLDAFIDELAKPIDVDVEGGVEVNGEEVTDDLNDETIAEWEERVYTELYAENAGINDAYASAGYNINPNKDYNGIEGFNELDVNLSSAADESLVLDIKSSSEIRVASKYKGSWVYTAKIKGTGLQKEDFCGAYPNSRGRLCCNVTGYKRVEKNDEDLKLVGQVLLGVGGASFAAGVGIVIKNSLKPSKPTQQAVSGTLVPEGIPVDPQQAVSGTLVPEGIPVDPQQAVSGTLVPEGIPVGPRQL